MKLTGYRLIVILTTAGFGLSKAALSYQGKSTTPTTLEWLYGIIITVGLYWIGLYEHNSSQRLPSLFITDYAAPLRRIFK
ncbi:hypothetical protein BD410DRAFT_735048 [Rickenella mellea]|uniref:Uncharacterized protein n=1 Tax=Rickenella mellea TaxID=50990 RepID=A0A4Y7PF49_9AGAM|nr:hypothetical protein BD410DRAFT_735048 [Rickenella mellea]